MKTLFSFILICCIAIGDFKTNAQEVFAPVGAEWWYYNLRHGGGVDITYEVLYHNRVTKDTLVEEQPCRAITQTAYARTLFWYGPITYRTDTIALRELYIYNNSDTVFIFNENFNQFTPLYVFNVQEGDTICLPIIPDIVGNSTDMRIHPLTGDRSFCFIIDSIRMVNYDTVILKTFYNHIYTGGSGIVYNWNIDESYSFDNSNVGIYAEKIGGLKAGLIPKPEVQGAERTRLIPFDNANTTFRCYLDSTIYLYTTTGSCDSFRPVPVSVKPIKSLTEKIVIYPNPAKEKVTIEGTEAFPVNTEVVLTDIAGKAVKSRQIGTGKTTITMELDNVHTGIYLLRIDAGKYSAHYKLVISR